MKQRIERLLVIALMSLAFISCSTEDDILPVPPPTPDPEEPVTPLPAVIAEAPGNIRCTCVL